MGSVYHKHFSHKYSLECVHKTGKEPWVTWTLIGTSVPSAAGICSGSVLTYLIAWGAHWGALLEVGDMLAQDGQ